MPSAWNVCPRIARSSADLERRALVERLGLEQRVERRAERPRDRLQQRELRLAPAVLDHRQLARRTVDGGGELFERHAALGAQLPDAAADGEGVHLFIVGQFGACSRGSATSSWGDSVTKAEICRNFTPRFGQVDVGNFTQSGPTTTRASTAQRRAAASEQETDMTIHATPGHPPLRAGDQTQTAAELQEIWDTDPRWDGIERTYTAEDVIALRGSVREESTLAHRGAENLWNLLHTEDYIRALGAYTGGQAVQQVRAGLKAIYLSGWQVAADGNLAGQTYPDQSLYPANSVPAVVRRINNALMRQDQIEHAEGETDAGLARADRGGCRGRLRRTAQRLRARAVAHPVRRRRHPLGGPAREREEVRPSRRQGAGADAAAHPHPQRRAARRRRRRTCRR